MYMRASVLSKQIQRSPLMFIAQLPLQSVTGASERTTSDEAVFVIVHDTLARSLNGD